MLSDADLQAMRASAATIRADREVTIRLWRESDAERGEDEQSLDQDVRLCFLGGRSITRASRTPQAEQITIPLLVKGPVDLDIQKDDHFHFDGTDYVIDLVRPDRSIETTAEARVLK